MGQFRWPWSSGASAVTFNQLRGKPATYPPPAATTTVTGGVKQSALVPNAAGANPTQAEYNGLLAALKAAGIMSTT